MGEKEGSEEKEKTMVKTKNRKIEGKIKKNYVNKGGITNLSKETYETIKGSDI